MDAHITFEYKEKLLQLFLEKLVLVIYFLNRPNTGEHKIVELNFKVDSK